MPNTDEPITPRAYDGSLAEWVAYMMGEMFLYPDTANEVSYQETGMEPYIVFFNRKEFTDTEVQQIGFGRHRWLRYEITSDGFKNASVVSRADMMEERRFYDKIHRKRAAEDERDEQRRLDEARKREERKWL